MAQNPQDRALSISCDNSYICGNGYGETYAEASNNALNDLLSHISVSLTSRSDLQQEAVNSDGEAKYKSVFNSNVTTYSQATLTNTESIIISETPIFHVFRYISRAELKEIFDLREVKLKNLVTEANTALNKGKIDVALRNYYWAYTLVKSLQYPSKAIYRYQGEDVQLSIWLPDRIEEILSDIKVRVTELRDNRALLYFTYKDNGVGGLDFTYWDGQSHSMQHHAKDGMAEIDLRPGCDPSLLRVNYVYKYAGKSRDEEIQSTVSVFGDDVFRMAEAPLCTAGMSVKEMVSKEGAKEMLTAVYDNNDLGLNQIKDYKHHNKAIQKVIKAFEDKDISSIRPLFTDQGWEMMTDLLDYGKAKVLGHQEYGFYELNDGRISCRSLTMQFAFPNNHRTFTEDVVFTFDKDRRIEGVTFGLGTEARDEIFSKGNRATWSETSMLAIADFLENYKTAFALKRLDYIESVFDDHAIIITGHVVKRTAINSPEVKSKLSYEEVRYTQHTKDEYIKRLRKIFANNEFINLRFSDNDVTRMSEGGELFAIQIHQDYYSEHYGDTGYLFLLVDINNPEEPIIKVRYWQPERNPNIHSQLPVTHRDYGIISASDF